VTYEMLAGYDVIQPFAGIRGTYVYGALALSVSMSVFLSRRFAQINRDLEARLREVRELSDRSLAQERLARESEIERRVLELDNKRKTSELEEARSFQLSLLPKHLPSVIGYELSAFAKPATEVGGDYYDVAISEPDILTIVVGDATGHGAKAGTLVAVTKGLFHELTAVPKVKDILVRCNHALKGMNLGGVYMGMILARLSANTLSIAAGGMPPIFVLRARSKKVELVSLKGMPLGAFADFPFQETSIKLDSGDVVVLMSDGYLEMFNPKGDTLGVARAQEVIERNCEESPHELIRRLIEDGDAWAEGRPQEDDVTFFVLKKL
jgi:serine phosphatase RsbU (regulator of sigma subunit)